MRSVVAPVRAELAGAVSSPGLRDYVRLTKPGVGLLLVFVAATAAVVAGPGAWREVVLVSLAGGIACAGAGALNHYLEQDIDSVMARTRRRPLPSGRVSPGRALTMGLALLALALALSLAINGLTTLFIMLGAFAYVVVYTWWLKRRTPWNIVIGGASGSLAVLAGWAAVTGGVSVTALAMGLVVFLWTPVHFWSFAIVHREEYARAGVPMLPVVVGERATARWASLHGVLTVAVSLIGLRGVMGDVYMGTAALAGIGLIGLVTWLNIAPGRKRARVVFLGSNVYLAVLFAAMMADSLL
ncbi:MAG: protoheme IX farnesyltransferase [Chloroflexi bacterium]|nr:protoheme IX farnesyltransferase [Chloroflexota bacterium]